MQSDPYSQQKVDTNWKGIVTLNTPEEADELTIAIQNVVPNAVEIFYHPTNSPVACKFIEDLTVMMQLYHKVLEIRTLKEHERTQARKLIKDMGSSAGKLKEEFGGATGRMLDPVAGKRLATHMRALLATMVQLSNLMDVQQNRMILVNALKAAQAVTMMKDVTRDVTYERHLNIYNQSFDALQAQVFTRMECLGEVGETEVRSKLRNAIDDIDMRRGAFLEAVQQENNVTTQIELQSEIDSITRSLVELTKICNDDKSHASGGFNHDVLTQSLDALQDAVNSGSAAAAKADAARKLAEELGKLENRIAVPDWNEDGPQDDAASRQALEDAVARLKALTKGLLGATKDALQQPSTDTLSRFDDLIAQCKADVVMDKGLDTVHATLPSSGLMDAATKAALELQDLFK